MSNSWINMFALTVMVLSATPVRADETLARASGCFSCHNMVKKGIGPSFQAIANKYKGNDSASAALIDVVRKGGKGNWTAVTNGVPMPPYSPRLSDETIRTLVAWVLRP